MAGEREDSQCLIPALRVRERLCREVGCAAAEEVDRSEPLVTQICFQMLARGGNGDV